MKNEVWLIVHSHSPRLPHFPCIFRFSSSNQFSTTVISLPAVPLVEIINSGLESGITLPGVKDAGLIDLLPLSGSSRGIAVFPEGQPLPSSGGNPITWVRNVSEGYYQAMSIPLLSGRQFTLRDRSEQPRVAVINQAMARRFWPGEDPIGKRFSGSPPATGSATEWFTVVGVCGGVRHTYLSVPNLRLPEDKNVQQQDVGGSHSKP
jgi:hypothetical protein